MLNVKGWIDLATSLGKLQCGLQGIQRWTGFDHEQKSGELFSRLNEQKGVVTSLQGVINRRLQTVDQHGIEMGELCDFFIHLFSPYFAEKNIKWDPELFRQAVRVHDFGETIHINAGCDISCTHKTGQNDKAEYDEYCRYLENTYQNDRVFIDKMRRVFLLQFCLEPDSFLPRDMISDLQTNHRIEALMFRAIESWGYFMYALDQYIIFRNVKIMHSVMHNRIVDYEYLSKNLPGYSELIWTDEMQDFRVKFLHKCDSETLT